MISEEQWRPLGVESEDQIAEYDALHDDVPPWMEYAFWAWVRSELTEVRGSIKHLNEGLVESMCQTLKIPFYNFRYPGASIVGGAEQLKKAMHVLRENGVGRELQIADYILAHSPTTQTNELDELFVRSKSIWTVGERSGKPGLTRRVPSGVQFGADAVMARSGRAGVRLAKAWENLYGIQPNASEAYRLAILAVEDISVPVVSPSNARATLGTVIKQMKDQGGWSLPMSREDSQTPSPSVLIGMIRMLWNGQHDRHGGQPSAPGKVSEEEAIVAVGLATTLVHWFDAGIISRDEGKKLTDEI